MKKSKKLTYEELLEEALENARGDRELILEAFENVKDALKTGEEKDIQTTLLIGEKPIKLLEALTKNNAQIVQILQIQEKKESKESKPEEEEESVSYTGSIEDLVKSLDNNTKIRIEEEHESSKKSDERTA